MRGAHHGVQLFGDRAGIIPADAGSTRYANPSIASIKDHPRGCGEHAGIEQRDRLPSGSSPRMRGAHLDKDDLGLNAMDHPRGCGEHSLRVSCTLRLSGSSPRMRGARRRWYLYGQRVGIIPADAGSTRCRFIGVGPGGDHPRGCGEHRTIRNHCTWSSGSSPRMRGALPLTELSASVMRIIPADAGSTWGPTISPASVQDHPRGRGEHWSRLHPLARRRGSSPRMRGAQGRPREQGRP